MRCAWVLVLRDHSSVSVQSISRQELRQLVCSELKALLELGNLEAAKVVLVPVQAVDIAEAIEGLPEAMQAIAFRLLSKDRAIEVYEYDAAHRLLGNLSLRDLVIAQPEETIGEIMNPHVICVHTDTDQEEVARELQHYDFIALPVVDAEQRLVGIVTVDDVIDILEEENTKDIHSLGGIQSASNNYFQISILNVVGRRLLWLLLVFCASSLAGVLLRVQEEFLIQAIALIAFIPFLIDSGGDVGAQSSTTVIRGISTNEIRSSQSLWVIGREAMAGALLGLILGVITIPWSYLLQGDWLVSLVVGISLFLITVLATVTGSALVFLFYFLGLDPAFMSIPLMTTIVDILGILVYLYVARLFLAF